MSGCRGRAAIKVLDSEELLLMLGTEAEISGPLAYMGEIAWNHVFPSRAL